MVTSASDGASGSGLHAIDCAEMKESHGREQRIIRKRNSEQEAIQSVRDNFKGSQWDLERTTLKLVDGINLVDRIRRDTKLNRNTKGDIYEKGLQRGARPHERPLGGTGEFQDAGGYLGCVAQQDDASDP